MAKRGGFPGGMPGNMNNIMKQAQKMQRQPCAFLTSSDMEPLGAERGKPAAGGEFQIFNTQHRKPRFHSSLL